MISIIIPCYNAERYLSSIIEDVLAQSYESWELLIVSNGEHQERQLKIACDYASKNNKIKVIQTKIGGGIQR